MALKGSDGRTLTYGEACQLAGEWGNAYFSSRHLVLTLCDYAFETVRFILEMFLLGQPMLLLQADISPEFLKGIMKKYTPYYIWRKADMEGEGEMCLQDGIYARRFRKILSEKLHIPPEMIHCKRIEQIPRSGAGKILYYQLC